MTRTEILAAAEACVNGERDVQYGSPEDSFTTIGELWGVYLGLPPIKPQSVAAMLIMLKIARAQTGPGHTDNWIDMAGYAACGGELDTPTED